MAALRHLCAALCLCVVPSAANAAVVINEIAWMGSAASPNDEWIELYNSGSTPVPLDGWTLTDGMNLSIALAGTLAAGAYAVLERTDDTSAPGTAFLIYTGALPNTGATLALHRADGIEDQVAGGENWTAIGGDNETKETPQYTGAGWITNTPTPGVANETGSSAPPVEEEDDEPPDTDDSGGGSSSRSERKSPEPPPKLVLSITAPEIAYVNQMIDMNALPSGISEDLLDSVTYTWSFGDAQTATGKDVRHTYRYPGDYVIVVDGGYARHEAVERREITVLPVTFTVTRTEAGDVQIHNDAVYEVDLSGYTLRSTKAFTFPLHTILLPRKTLTVPRAAVGGSARSPVALFDTEYHMVASNSVPAGLAPAPSVLGAHTTNVPERVETSDASAFLFDSDATSTAPQVLSRAAPATATAGSDARMIPQRALPYLGLIGVLSVALVALYAGRSHSPV